MFSELKHMTLDEGHTTLGARSAPKSQNITWTAGRVTPDERESRNGHRGAVVWFTGLSGSGKSTLAKELERRLFDLGRQVYVLDGDNLRHGLCTDLGFAPNDRKENIRRLGEVAKLLADAGLICITAFISPYRSDRDQARQIMREGRFFEIHLSTPVEVCEQRDPKGLYAKARAGQIEDFTGISAPYEEPLKPELQLRTDESAVTDCVDRILKLLDGGLKPNASQP